MESCEADGGSRPTLLLAPPPSSMLTSPENPSSTRPSVVSIIDKMSSLTGRIVFFSPSPSSLFSSPFSSFTSAFFTLFFLVLPAPRSLRLACRVNSETRHLARRQSAKTTRNTMEAMPANQSQLMSPTLKKIIYVQFLPEF